MHFSARCVILLSATSLLIACDADFARRVVEEHSVPNQATPDLPTAVEVDRRVYSQATADLPTAIELPCPGGGGCEGCMSASGRLGLPPKK